MNLSASHWFSIQQMNVLWNKSKLEFYKFVKIKKSSYLPENAFLETWGTACHISFRAAVQITVVKNFHWNVSRGDWLGWIRFPTFTERKVDIR